MSRELLLLLCVDLESRTMSEKTPLTEEEQKNNRFSFVVGILIALAIIVLFVILFK